MIRKTTKRVFKECVTDPLCSLVFFDAPDMVLVERFMGKRVDPDTGGEWKSEHWPDRVQKSVSNSST